MAHFLKKYVQSLISCKYKATTAESPRFDIPVTGMNSSSNKEKRAQIEEVQATK